MKIDERKEQRNWEEGKLRGEVKGIRKRTVSVRLCLVESLQTGICHRTRWISGL